MFDLRTKYRAYLHICSPLNPIILWWSQLRGICSIYPYSNSLDCVACYDCTLVPPPNSHQSLYSLSPTSTPMTTLTSTSTSTWFSQAREVLQITLSGLEVRHAVTHKYTDSSMNLESFQVRNMHLLSTCLLCLFFVLCVGLDCVVQHMHVSVIPNIFIAFNHVASQPIF